MRPSRRQTAASPARVGNSRRHSADSRLLLYMGLLILVGLVVLFAISPYQIHRINAEGGSLDQGHYMLKQLTYLGIGAGVFSLSTMLPIPLWRRLASPLLLGAIALCMLLALLGAFSIPPAMCFNGACRWFDFGITSFQPAEMLKFAIVLYMAVFLAARVRDGKLNDLHQTLIPVITVLGIAALFVIGLQKDMGTGITIFGAVLTMLFLAGLSMRWIALGGVGLVVLGGLLIVISPHRIERVTTFLSGNNVADASSYHIDMAKLAIGSGGLFGKGLGNGVQAFGYLPEALNDSIFAVLGEIFGFLGLIVIIGLFVALLVRIVQTSERLQDPMMQLFVAGTFGWLGTHVIVNIGAMTGVLPLTGVTLPFLSFGGTSLVFMMATLGIVFQMSRYTTFQIKGGSNETTRSRRGFGRSRYASPSRHQ